MSESSLSPRTLPLIIQQDSNDSTKLLESLASFTSSITVHLIIYRIEVPTIITAFDIGHEISLGPKRDSILLEALSTFIPVTSEMYILKELCATKDGRAIVNLCCCLGVGYDEDYASEVLVAIAGGLETSEQGNEVSKTQWVLLLQVCAMVFGGDIFKQNIQAILDLGMTQPPTVPLLLTTPDNPTSKTLSTILLDLAQIASGNLRAVHVTGIDQCGFIAVWAEDVLGLRLEIYDQDGNMKRRSFVAGVQKAQVTVRFVKVQGLSTDLLTVVTEE